MSINRLRKFVAGVFVILIGIFVLRAALRRDLVGDVPTLSDSTLTIVPGIHLLGNLGPAVAYVVQTSEGLVLIDSGLDSDAALLKAEMARLGLDWKRIRAILLTHVHGDHCGGAEELRATTGARVYAGQADVPFLNDGTSQDAIFAAYTMSRDTLHHTTVDVALQGNETISFGDACFQVLGTPGHSPGSTCYLLERGGVRALFSGDVIQKFGDQPLGTYLTYMAPRYRGDARAYLASLQTLRGLSVPDLVLPGHPNLDPVPQIPHLTRKRWEAMLDGGIHDMELLVSRYEADGANFLDGVPKRLLPDLYYLGDFKGSAVYGFFVSSNFFVVDAPGGSGLADFLADGLRQLGLKPATPTAVLLTSCGEKETAGLRELVEHCHAQIVASPAGVEAVRRLCPPGSIVVSADDLPGKGWFPVTPMMLGGRGTAPIAYLVPWTGKAVLFSGRIPTKVSDQDLRNELLSELGKSSNQALAYVDSIQKLLDVHPDLWLPAAPSKRGQNANMYDNSWNGMLDLNYQTGISVLQRK